jgi:hypothetical protein
MSGQAAPCGELVGRALATERLVVDNPRRGREIAEAIAHEARSVDDYEAEVIACRWAAWAARELYDHGAARQLLNRARSVARARRLPWRLGQIWVTWSAVHLELGDLRSAARDLVAAREAFSPAEPVELTFAEGLVAQKAGRVDDAITAYRQVMATATPDQPDVRFKAANNLGEVLIEAGQIDEAEAVLTHAATAAEELGSVFGAIAAVNRAAAAVHRGHLASAERHYARAEELARQADMPLVEFRLEYVTALRSAGLWPEAEAELTLLVRQLDAPGAALLRADANLLLAEAALRNGDPSLALAAAADAKAGFTAQRRASDRAAAVEVAAEATVALAKVGAWRPASVLQGPRGADAPTALDPLGPAGRASLRRAAHVLAARGERERAVAAWLLVGHVAALRDRRVDATLAWRRAADLASDGPVLVRSRGHLARALAAPTPVACRRACAVGLADIDAHREGVASSELRARLATHGQALSAVALASLPRTARPRPLLRWLEAGRSVGQVATDPLAHDETIANDLAALRRLSRPVELGSAGTTTATEQAQLLQQRRLENRVRRRAWTDAAHVHPRQPLKIGPVLERLGTATLVAFGTMAGRLVAVSLSGGQVRRHELGHVRPLAAAVRSLVFAAKRLTGADQVADTVAPVVATALVDLDDALVRPVIAGRGDAPSELILVPPAQLAGVPWGALPSCSGRPVRVLPSVRTWLDTASVAPVRCASPVPTTLVAGPDLPGAEAEVRYLAGRRDGAKVLTPVDATAEAPLAALDGATLAHVACHGTSRLDAPLFSSLHLVDGPLTVYDIERIPRLPVVWVLAACDVGRLVLVGAAGDPLGFPSVLLQRGARAVIAPHVPVLDVDTSLLMVELHDELLAGSSSAEALASAQARIDRSAPAGLATALAFTCYGGG